MEERICVACKQPKPLSEFYKKSGRVGQYLSNCKPCHIRITNANPKIKERIADWSKRNKNRRAQQARDWRSKNPEKVKEVSKRSRIKHRDRYRMLWRRKGVDIKQRIPAWADLNAMHAVYLEASRRSTSTGIPQTVDHIVPLRSGLVCGLHCEANLQILPRTENFRKGNRHWPDMPC